MITVGAARIWKFPKFNLLRMYDVDLLGTLERFFRTSFELRAVHASVFCHLSPRPAGVVFYTAAILPAATSK